MRRAALIRRLAAVVAVAGAILAVPVSVGGWAPSWDQLADVPDPQRQEVSYVALGDAVYLAAGGELAHYRYRPGSDTWEPVESLPGAFSGVDHVHGVAVGGKIVYIGGIETFEHPFPVSSAVAVYDPVSDEFTLGAPMERPRGAGGVAAWQGKVIYAGGLGPDGAVAWVDEYDPVADEWRQRADMPRARDHFQAAVVDESLYAIGGRDTFEDGGLEFDERAEVDVLDLATDGWTPAVTSLPTPRGGHGVAVVGHCIVVIGGEVLGGLQAGVTGVVEEYDTTTGEWRTLPSLQTPRHGIQAAALGDTVHVAAGGTAPAEYQPTPANESLAMAPEEPCATGAGDGGTGDGGDGGTAEGGDAGDGDEAGAGGGSAGQGEDPVVEPEAVEAAATLRALRLRPRTIRLRTRGRRGRRALLVFALSRPARVRIALRRAVVRRRGCRRPCVRWRAVRRHRSIRGHTGRNAMRFPLRWGGRTLRPGRYRLVVRIAGRRGPLAARAVSLRVRR